MCKKLAFLISLVLVFALCGATAVQAGTLDFRVPSGNDDAEQDLGDNSMDLTSSDLEIIKDGTANQIVGLRFTGINIAKGTIINSAYVEFEVDALPTGSADAVNVVINGELAANAAAFTSTANDLSGRVLTTAKVNWSIPAWAAVDAKSQSVDLKAVIQEIVNQDGWEPGNALVLLIRDDSAAPSVGTREAESYDGEAAAAPLLHIEFEGDPVQLTIHNIWREAEAADPLTAPMETYDDDPTASGGQYIGAALGTATASASPAPAGTASYIFSVPEAGTYKVVLRLKVPADSYDDDSCYVRIDGATINTTVLVGGWIKFNGIADRTPSGPNSGWTWVTVFASDDGNKNMEFTMAAGQYTLEIAHREDGLYFDGLLITDDLALDISTLPNEIPACVEENILLNGGFEDGFGAPWVFDNASPAYEIVGNAQDSYNALKVTIAAPGSQQYIPALAQPGFSFEAGKKYTFSVFLKGSSDGMQVYMKPQQRGGSYTGYGAEYKTLTTEWAEYSVTTPVFSSTVATADVSIWLGMQAGEVYIDHARFYEGDYVTPCPAKKVAVMTASRPQPEDGATGLKRQVTLSWDAGVGAGTHDVYIGTSMQDVTNAAVANPLGVLVSQDQNDLFYDFTSGEYGTTYYWRVDEVNAAEATLFKGTVWSFTTKPIGLILPQESITVSASGQKDATQDANNTINGSGLNAQNQHGTDKTTMWLSDTNVDPNKAWIRYGFDQLYKLPRMLIWNHNLSGISGGYAIKGVDIEYSADGGATWTLLPDVNELPKGIGKNTYTPIIVDLGGVADGIAANAIRITANSNWSTNGAFKQSGLSEVKFYYIPVWPENPNPADDANNVSYNKPKLTWNPGEGSVQHKVYFGMDEMTVINGSAPSSTVDSNNWTAPELILGKTYFWRVEEVNMAAVPSVWSGQTWSFTVQDYRVVEDFESYTGSISTTRWTGGSTSSGNGATIGPVETSIVHEGGKSMKFLFDDRSTQGYSEISGTTSRLTSGTNWKTGSPMWLVFWIYGDAANVTSEKLYVKLNNDAMYWYRQPLVSASDITAPKWTQVVVPLIPSEVNLGNVSSLKIGLIRNAFTTGTGVIYIDDIRLYNSIPMP